LLFIIIVLLFFLAYLVILYLYKTYSAQKILSSFVPLNIMRENSDIWKKCSGLEEFVKKNVPEGVVESSMPGYGMGMGMGMGYGMGQNINMRR
jgi:hypothetical protein